MRFGLSELQQYCEQYTGNPAEDPREQERDASQTHEPPEPQQSLVDTQFLELLRSMWEHEDGDSEKVGEADRAAEGEEGGGDGEIKDDIVNEDELDEIYEFAATQRKMGAEADVSTESGDEEEVMGANNRSGAEGTRDEGKQNAKMEEETDMQCRADDDLNSGSNKNVGQSRGPGGTLDRSYNRLFSESWGEGEYKEPSQTQTLHSDRKTTPTSRRISSVSEVIDLSVSPPGESGEQAGSLFPVTGLSPGETQNQSEVVQVTPENPNALGKTQLEVTPSLPSSTKPRLSAPAPDRSQPEVIVLSDSSDDADHDLPDEVPSRGDSSRPPTSSPSRLGLLYTHIKAKETTLVPLSPERSNETPRSVYPEPSISDRVGNDSVLDGSAEVSWLIPATPEPSTRTNSTQTSSSMRRTRLFPRSCSSVSDKRKSSNSFEEPHREHSQPSPAFLKLTSYSRWSKTSHSDPVNRAYPNSASEPCSSTPLHSDPRLQRLDPLGSPLLGHSEPRTRRAGQEGGLGSIRLSPTENSSSPRRSSRSEKESSKSPAMSQHCDNPGDLGDELGRKGTSGNEA
ncbi:hypothetical protein AMELA_G00001080 [Ameiurus melas]|uniref:Uncharacterized protein n=1 Tax=Ameiurus melas TaxID=219545 RepID=A0A7J6BE14_AMEME|nr:hypothetical protein AMELA_G00001080 [Ameiurus melas]